jgi:hypothetical protein
VCYCNEAIGSIVLSSPCHSRPRVLWHLGMHSFSHNSCLFFRSSNFWSFRDGYEVHYVHIDLGQTSTKVERFWQVPLSCILFSLCECGGGQLVQERCGLHH